MNDAFRILNERTPVDSNSASGRGGGGNGRGQPFSGVSFLQNGNVPGTDGKTYQGITCYKCQDTGHYADMCPQVSSSSRPNVQMLQSVISETNAVPTDIKEDPEGDDGSFGLSFSQTASSLSPPSIPSLLEERGGVPLSWLVMDSGSSINTARNSELLTDIVRVNGGMTSFTNAGSTTYSLKGTFQGMMDFWYDPDGLANIISLARLSEVSRVVFDSSDGEMFIAYLPDGRVWNFVKSSNGLYFYDTANDPNFSNRNVTDYCFVTTVQDNIKRYHRREIDKAKKYMLLSASHPGNGFT